MAKNWTLAEIANSVKENNMEDMLDFGKRFPITSNLISTALSGNEDNLEVLFNTLNFVTAGKIEKTLKIQIENGTFGERAEDSSVDEDVSEEDEANEEEVEETSKKDKSKTDKAKEDGEVKDFDSMSSKELWDFMASKKVPIKERGKNVKEYREICKKMFGGDSAATTADKESSEYDGKSAKELYGMCKEAGLEPEQKKPASYYIELLESQKEDEADDKDYTKMSAKELYVLCKEKGLKPEQKKPVKYYIELLEDEDEDDGWGDDEDDEDEKPKPNSKSKKKDEDEGWEI